MRIKEIAIFFALFFLFVGEKVSALDRPLIDNLGERITRSVNSRGPIVFSDENYSQPALDFSSGQNIYIKVVSVSSGSKEKKVRLLNSEKSEVQSRDFSVSGNEFTAVLTAPQGGGVYYIDVKIDDGSSVYTSQQNINVGEVSGADVVSSAESRIEVKVTSGAVKISEIKITPVDEEEKPLKQEIPKVNFLNKVHLWWQKFLSYLTNWLK